MATQKAAYMGLDDALKRKFAQGSRRRSWITGNPWFRPWVGLSYRAGKLHYWPAEDVERWCEVLDHNFGEYVRELLGDPREYLRENLRAHLTRLVAEHGPGGQKTVHMPDWVYREIVSAMNDVEAA